MNARTYHAPTMAEALAEVKKDLGRDAVILHTRNFRKGALLGILGGTPTWEVTATPSENVPPHVLNRRRANEAALANSKRAAEDAPATDEPAANDTPDEPAPADEVEADAEKATTGESEKAAE